MRLPWLILFEAMTRSEDSAGDSLLVWAFVFDKNIHSIGIIPAISCCIKVITLPTFLTSHGITIALDSLESNVGQI